jgi:hypothetical protein
MKIDEITNKINSYFSAMNAKVSKMIPMPAVLLLCASLSRPGLSPLRSISNVCAALEGLGIPTGDNPDGSPNLVVKAMYELIKENYRAMCEDASVQGASEIGSVVSTGANSGGAVVTTNILPFSIRGVIQ